MKALDRLREELPIDASREQWESALLQVAVRQVAKRDVRGDEDAGFSLSLAAALWVVLLGETDPGVTPKHRELATLIREAISELSPQNPDYGT